jgi:hypothetical protein
MSIPSPTIKFLAMATPPAVLIEPLFKFVLGVVFVAIIAPVNVKLPSTSSASLVMLD